MATRSMVIARLLGTLCVIVALLAATAKDLCAQFDSTQVRENLGPAVNTASIEILPLVSPDGRTLYFDRKYSAGNVGGVNDDDDIYYSTLDENESWSLAKNIGGPLNSAGSDVLFWIASDGATALIYSGREIRGRKMGLAITRRSGDAWGEPRPISIQGITDLGESYYAFISADGRRLLLAYTLDTSNPDNLDIYYAPALSNDLTRWGTPINLGSVINTMQFDGAPFLAADNRTLYFASSRIGGYGQSDIWMSRRTGESWLEWSEPVNLGPEVNSMSYEASLSIPASGEYIYLSGGAFRGELTFGKSDIYRLRLPPELRPEPFVLVRGRLTDGAAGLRGLIIAETATNRRQVMSTASDSAGSFMLSLPVGAQYRLNGSAPGYLPATVTVEAAGAEGESVVTLVLARDPDAPTVSAWMGEMVYFDTGSDAISADTERDLRALLPAVRERLAQADVRVVVTGHADAVGETGSNRELSLRRARTVRRWLTANGIDSKRIIVRGEGESSPADSNETPEGRAMNRRVEISVATGNAQGEE